MNLSQGRGGAEKKVIFWIAISWAGRYFARVATVSFTQNLRRHLESELKPVSVDAGTVAGALEQVFAEYPRLKGYILDDQGEVRKHVAVFLNGETVADRARLSDALPADGDVFVAQALSGG